jgi:hypothetical protein
MPIPDLQAFPYPFVSNELDDPLTTIFLPPDPTTAEIAKGLSLASSLGRFDFAGLNLDMMAYKESLETSLSDTNLIILGTPERQPLVSKITDSLNADATQLVTEALNNPLIGILLEAPSSWNPDRTALVITGNSQEAFERAADALFDAAPPVRQPGSLAVVEPQQEPNIIYSVLSHVEIEQSTVSSTSQPEDAVTAIPVATPETVQPQPELPIPSGQLVALIVVPPLIIGLIALVWALRTRRSRQ